jgi:hypothetical protein
MPDHDLPAGWHPAIPVDYLNPGSRVGKVYAAIADGPPLRVREQAWGSDSGDTQIVIELENFVGVASSELIDQLRLPELRAEPVLRLALHPTGARKLCLHLLTALAGTGDRVAGLAHEKTIEAMNEIGRQRQGDVDG